MTAPKKNVTMAFYIEKEQPNLDTDTLGVGLGVSLHQVRDGMQL